MPIAVACSCGVKLKAPDAAAGKRVKCPKCGNPVSVPAPAAAADFEMVDDDPPPVAAPVKKKPKLVDDDDPPTTRKMPTSAKTKPMPKPKPKPVEVDEAVDDDEDEEEDEKPKKKGKGKGKKKKEEPKSKLPLILGIGGGVVGLLVIVGIVVAVMMNSGGQAKGTGTQPTTPPKPALPAGWSTFKGEGFSVGLPPGVTFGDKPIEAVSLNPAAVIIKQWSNSAQAQATGVGYEVGKIQLNRLFVEKFQKDPRAGWDELLKTVAEMPQGAGKPTVQPSSFAGETDGREITGDLGGQGKMTVRMAIKGEYLYAVTYASKTPDAETARTFFDSFKVE